MIDVGWVHVVVTMAAVKDEGKGCCMVWGSKKRKEGRKEKGWGKGREVFFFPSKKIKIKIKYKKNEKEKRRKKLIFQRTECSISLSAFS